MTRPQSRIEAQQQRNALGKAAEDLVQTRLEEQGFEILARNLRVGRDELDIVARKGPLLVVCEVRARTNVSWMTPAQSITRAKIASVRRGVATLLRQWRLPGVEVRLDVASVVVIDGEPSINYLEGALH